MQNISSIIKAVNYLANGDTGHPFRDSVVDAAISAGSAFFATIGGMAVAGIQADPRAAAIAGAAAAGGAFFLSLRVARERAGKFRRKRRG